MKTIENIQFDRDYSHASIHFLLLHDHDPHQIGASMIFELRNALLLTFIRPFHNLFDCQQHISNSRQKMITLFISNNKLLDWHKNINDIDHNLHKVFIYCNTFVSYLHMQKWNGCYHGKIQEVFMYDKLDFRLIHAGVDYIHTICEELHEDNGLRTKFDADGRRLCAALGDYFGHRATKSSVETTEH